MTSRVISVPDVLIYLGHEFIHSLASMIPGDVVMQVSPDPFGSIVVGAIGWQEVEFHLVTQHLQRKLHLQTVVNAVVVQNEVDRSSSAIGLGHQFVEKLQKQQADFPFTFNPSEFASPRIAGAIEVALVVASRCKNLLLFSRQHPVRSDFGSQMDVHLVAVQYDLVFAQIPDEPSDGRQPTHPTPSRPTAVDHGLGSSQPNTEPGEGRMERYPLLAAYHQEQREIWARDAWPTTEHVCSYPNVRSEQQEMLKEHVGRFGPKAGRALDRALQHHNLSEGYTRASDLSWLDVLFDNILP
jgi:hypothetical protein